MTSVVLVVTFASRDYDTCFVRPRRRANENGKRPCSRVEKAVRWVLTRDTLTVRGRERSIAPIQLGIKDDVYHFVWGSTRVFELGNLPR